VKRPQETLVAQGCPGKSHRLLILSDCESAERLIHSLGSGSGATVQGVIHRRDDFIDRDVAAAVAVAVARAARVSVLSPSP